MNIFQRSSLDSTAKVPIKTEMNKLTTVEASELIPYDEGAALIEDDNKHDSTNESLAKEVERSNECQEFLSTRKDSLTLLSATFESILLVEKTPIIKSLQEKERTIEEYLEIEHALRDKVKKLESFIDSCNTIQTKICKRHRSYVGELNHKLTAADKEKIDLELQLKAVHDENTALVQVKSSMQEKHTLELLTIKREKEALKRNIVELKSKLRTNMVDVIIITFLGFVLGLLLDPVPLTRWLRGEM